MVQFLDNIDEDLTKSMTKGAYEPYMNIPVVATTKDTCAILASRIKRNTKTIMMKTKRRKLVLTREL